MSWHTKGKGKSRSPHPDSIMAETGLTINQQLASLRRAGIPIPPELFQPPQPRGASRGLDGSAATRTVRLSPPRDKQQLQFQVQDLIDKGKGRGHKSKGVGKGKSGSRGPQERSPSDGASPQESSQEVSWECSACGCAHWNPRKRMCRDCGEPRPQSDGSTPGDIRIMGLHSTAPPTSS